MPEFDFDLYVIGAGSGGVRAARMAAASGASVAIAEAHRLGGTCVNLGCIPKKLFVYASEFAREFRNADGYGWHVSGTDFDFRRLVANKDAEIAHLNEIYRQLLTAAGVTLHEGRATLTGPHAVRVNGRTHTARHILVATGGRPVVPNIEGHEHAITSNEAFHLDCLPESITIIGGGYIAIEFAGIFNGLGVDTTLIYRGPLFLRGFDDEVRAVLAAEMEKNGVHLRFNTHIQSIQPVAGSYRVGLDDGTGHETGRVMFATGRAPATSGLGLEELGVQITADGAISVNAQYQTNVPSIYALGDVTHRIQLTPVALAEAMVLVRHLFHGDTRVLDYEFIPTAVFSQPPIGTIGYTEAEATRRFGAIRVYKTQFTPLKAALTPGDEEIFMKLIVDAASDRVIGAHMVGGDAAEIIQGIAIAIRAGATKQVFDATIGIHPSAAEEFVTMRESVGSA